MARNSVSPSPRRTPSRNRAAPKRLGDNDGFDSKKANAFASPAPAKTAKAVERGKALYDQPGEFESSGGISKIIGIADVLVLAASLYAFNYAMPVPYLPLKMPELTPKFLQQCGFIAMSHLVYAFVWFKSSLFKKLCKKLPLKLVSKKPVVVFEVLVLVSKTVQQLTLLSWAGLPPKTLLAKFPTSPDAVSALIASVTQDQLLAAGLLLGVGQGLNVAIYKAIGRDGVYYGFKLGRKVEWSTAFPFNAGFRHPQYVGGFICQLGVLLHLATPSTVADGLAALGAFWALCYVLTSVVESMGDNN